MRETSMPRWWNGQPVCSERSEIMKRFAIGTDIGGTHISCAIFDFERKAVLQESLAIQKVNHQGSAEEILSNWATALTKTMARIDHRRLAGIGFAMPGPFDYARGIALFTGDVAKFQGLYGINVSERIQNLLGVLKFKQSQK